MTITASEIKNLLHDNIVEVVFTKKNGETRTLRGTLRQDLIESNNLVPVGGGHQGPENQVRLIDLDKKEWRSFNIENLVSYTVVEDISKAA